MVRTIWWRQQARRKLRNPTGEAMEYHTRWIKHAILLISHGKKHINQLYLTFNSFSAVQTLRQPTTSGYTAELISLNG